MRLCVRSRQQLLHLCGPEYKYLQGRSDFKLGCEQTIRPNYNENDSNDYSKASRKFADRVFCTAKLWCSLQHSRQCRNCCRKRLHCDTSSGSQHAHDQFWSTFLCIWECCISASNTCINGASDHRHAVDVIWSFAVSVQQFAL